MDGAQERPVSPKTEAAGWLGFVLFVAVVYWLRQALNRSMRER